MIAAMRQGRDIVARHGETVLNAAARLQGQAVHTPLTRAGFAQADAIGRALRKILGTRPALQLWASPTGRALQTLAVIVEHLGLDWHEARTDARLGELDMGSWGGRHYAEVIAAAGRPIVRADGMLHPAPDGERYAAAATRIGDWLADSDAPGDRLVVMHGLSSRVMRGMMTGRAPDPEFGVPVAPGLPQGSAVLIDGGEETVIHRAVRSDRGAPA
jgi:probable phosphoglycerate mutase